MLSSQLLNTAKQEETGRRGRKRGAWGGPWQQEGEKSLQEPECGNLEAPGCKIWEFKGCVALCTTIGPGEMLQPGGSQEGGDHRAARTGAAVSW